MKKQEIKKLSKDEIIKNIDKEHRFIIDPHTATGFGAVREIQLKNVVVLGTAHPFKFNDTIKKTTGKNVEAPKYLKINVDKKERFDIVDNSSLEVKNYILSKL